MSEKGLNREQLKILAIIAMVTDHTAWGFVEFMTPLGQAMHLFGRLTLPIMCFFLAEGYRHTKSLRAYLSRMSIFAVISVIPFWMFFREEYGIRQNIIFDLTLALVSLTVLERRTLPKPVRALLFTLLMILSLAIGGWVVMPILYTLIFYYAKTFRSKALLFIGATCLMQAILLPTILLNERYHFSPYNWTVPERLYLFGFIFALIPLYFYNGKKGKSYLGRYFFYFFYPMHFLALCFIRFLLTNATAQSTYILAHVIALGIVLAMLIYVIHQTSSRAQMAVTFLMTCCLMYVFGFLMEITSAEVAGVYTATKLQYFAEVLIMIAMTLCSQELCHARIPGVIYAVESTVSVIVIYYLYTYEQNGLFYSAIRINTEGPFPRMQVVSYGPVFYFFTAYSLVVCIMCIFIGARSARNADRIQKKRLRFMLYAVIAMWLPYTLKVLGVVRYEIPALFIPVAALFLTVALVRYSYLDSVSLAFSNAINQGREGILIIDNNHRVLYHNDWIHRIFGDFSKFHDAYKIPGIMDAFTGRENTVVIDGHTYEFRVEPLVECGHETGRILWVFDLTEHYRYLEKVKEASVIDSLTGLHNRAWFEEEMRRLLTEKVAGAFFMADLDHFKQVNDTYGHQTGDEVLMAFANAFHLEEQKLPPDTLISGRFGGDEFCIYYKGETDHDVLSGFADTLIKDFDTALMASGHAGVTALSLGITVVDPETLPVSVWIAYTRIHEQADQALYVAKEAGRKTWRYYVKQEN